MRLQAGRSCCPPWREYRLRDARPILLRRASCLLAPFPPAADKPRPLPGRHVRKALRWDTRPLPPALPCPRPMPELPDAYTCLRAPITRFILIIMKHVVLQPSEYRPTREGYFLSLRGGGANGNTEKTLRV